MTYCVYTAQRVRSFWCALSVLTAVCVLSPAHLEHCSRYTSVHTCFGCVLRGRFVPRTWFDHVPAGTVLAGTILFRTRSDYKKWCVPRTCSENMFPLELYREQVWTPGRCTKWTVDRECIETDAEPEIKKNSNRMGGREGMELRNFKIWKLIDRNWETFDRECTEMDTKPLRNWKQYMEVGECMKGREWGIRSWEILILIDKSA